jgi:hypothetical protein
VELRPRNPAFVLSIMTSCDIILWCQFRCQLWHHFDANFAVMWHHILMSLALSLWPGALKRECMQGVSTESLKFHPGPPWQTLLRSMGRPSPKRPYGCFGGGPPAAIFYPLGYPTRYGPEYDSQNPLFYRVFRRPRFRPISKRTKNRGEVWKYLENTKKMGPTPVS